MDSVALVLIVLAGLSTILGALPVAVVRRFSHRTHDTILGFTGGVMLGVAVLGLLFQGGGNVGENAGMIVAGMAIGVAVIILLIIVFRRMPLPMPFVKNGERRTSSAAVLLFISLMVHNAPEGLATGIGYSHGVTSLGNGIALAISFQNIPEGLLVATAVAGETGSRRKGVWYGILSGLVEPVVGLIAFFALALSPAAIWAASGFAAGAMLCVVFFQIIPESHRHGHQSAATAALVVGIALAAGMNLLMSMMA